MKGRRQGQIHVESLQLILKADCNMQMITGDISTVEQLHAARSSIAFCCCACPVLVLCISLILQQAG